MGVITVTEIEQVRRCGWQHDFGSLHRMGLESANPLRSLYLGTLWHSVLDSLAQRQTYIANIGQHQFDLDPRSKSGRLCKICGFNVEAHSKDPFLAHAGALTNRIRSHYEEVAGRPISQVEMKPTYDTIEMCKAMLDNYLAFYNGRLLPEEYEYVQTEQQFFKVLPNTNHCTCYSKPKCVCVGPSCRYKHSYYQHCKCEGTLCECREDHTLEGKLDGVIKHKPTNTLDILENKTFSFHPVIEELKRTSQFMGYKWIGLDLGVNRLFYNGAWSKDHVPDGYNRTAGRKWTKQDLFLQRTVEWQPAEIENWACQTAITAMQIFDPKYQPVRTVHPVGGCNGVNSCSYKTLCDARFTNNIAYDRILRNEYRKRESFYDEPTI